MRRHCELLEQRCLLAYVSAVAGAMADDAFLEDFESGDFDALPWSHSGDTSWVITGEQVHGGTHSARPGTITHNQTSRLEVTLATGAGEISFWRKVSSEARYDFLTFFIDGATQQQWSGEEEWGQETYSVSAGNHTFTWEYTKDGSVSRGADTAWLDDIVVPLAGQDTTPPAVTLIAPAPDSTVTTTSTSVDVTFSEAVHGVDATDLELGGTAADRATVGTPTDQGGNTWRFPITGLDDGALGLTLAPDANDIQDLAGNDLAPQRWDYTVSVDGSAGGTEDFETGDFSRLPWTHGGDASWVITSDDAHGGTRSARPGTITHHQTSKLEVTLATGAGEVTFWRKVSSEARYDFLTFSIDGAVRQQWSGDEAWGQAAYVVSAGNHTFTWEYTKDGSVSRGADTAGLDDIVFPVAGDDTTPPRVTAIVPAPDSTVTVASSSVEVTFSEAVQGVDATDLLLGGAAAGTATVGTPTDQGGNTWRFPITGLQDGSLRLNLASDANDIRDLAGNDLAPQSWQYTVSLSAPAGSTEDFETGDFSRLPWTHAGDAPWVITGDDAHGGTRSARPGTMTHNQASRLEVTLATGPGEVTFWRKVSSEPRYDFLIFSIDGVMQQRWSGNEAWGQETYVVSAGDHTFTWEYAKDGSVSLGADTAWLDDIVFPDGAEDTTPPVVSAIVPAPDSTVTTSSLSVDVTFSEAVQGLDATDVELGGTAAGGATVGAPTDQGGNTWRFPLTGLGDGSLRLSLAPDAHDVQDLAGNDLAPRSWGYTVSLSPSGASNEGFETGDFSRLPWHHGGDAPWVITSDQAHGGTRSARPGTTGHDQTSRLEVTLATGAGEVSFWRKVSSESRYDFLIFSIDGVLQQRWSGEAAWGQETYVISEGDHTFTWEYVKDGSVSRGADTTWLDDMIFPEAGEDTTPPFVVNIVPAPTSTVTTTSPSVDVTFSEAVQGVDATDLELGGTAAGTAIVGTPADLGDNTWRFPITGLEDGELLLTLAPDANDIQDLAGNHLLPDSWGYSVLIGVGAVNTEDFETGDFNRLPWTHTGDAQWVITGGERHGGTRSARPGTLDHQQTSRLEVTVTTEAGEVSFWRKVSSEAGYDFLTFLIDGVPQQRWSGEVAWGQAGYSISAGNHTFAWEYAKDRSVSRGADTAWLDDIVFPVEGVDATPPIVTTIAPAADATVRTDSFDVDVTFSEPVQGVDATDLELVGTAAGSASVGPPIDLGGATWRFPITGLVHGSLVVNLAPDPGDVQDLAGNDLAPQSWGYTISPSFDPDRTEDFESGDFNKFPWLHLGDTPWTITNDQSRRGVSSARSGSIGDSRSSTLEVTLATGDGNISFWRKVSSQAGDDYLDFLMDGAPQQRWSGEVDWALQTYHVDAGVHTFSWEYSKGSSTSAGSDAAWLDDIVFPLADTGSQVEIDPPPNYRFNSSRIVFRVTFAEEVQGVDVTDLQLTGAAAGTAIVEQAFHDSGNTWRFVVRGLRDGSLGLILAPDPDDIVDRWGNSLDPIGWQYMVGIPPLVLRTEPPFGDLVYSSSFDLDVVFSEPVQGVDVTDVELYNTPDGSPQVGTPTYQGNDTWRFPITGLVSGPLNVTLAPDPGDIQDLAGNFMYETGFAYTILVPVVGSEVEDFETGDFSRFPWTHAGDAPWFVTPSEHQAGSYSAQAGHVTEGQASILTITRSMQAGDISFWSKVSSHYGSGYLSFYIDGVLSIDQSGEEEWRQTVREVPAGTHRFTWEYAKRERFTAGLDTAWIDEITFPVWEDDTTPPTVVSRSPYPGDTITTTDLDATIRFADEAIRGVDVSDLELSGPAAASATIGKATYMYDRLWQFPITGLRDGALHLTLAPDPDDIEDLAGNDLVSESWSYTVDIPPAVSGVEPAYRAWITSEPFHVDVTFTESVQGVDVSDLVLSGTAAESALVGTPSYQGGRTWRFPISGHRPGDLYLTLAPDVDDIQDLSGNYVRSMTWFYEVTQIAAYAVDGFESADFSELGWIHAGDAPWTISSSDRNGGAFSARSGEIGHGQTSTLAMSMITAEGPVSFWRKVSSEADYDGLTVYVDGHRQSVHSPGVPSYDGPQSGELDWGQLYFFIDDGPHTFLWEYAKDDSRSTGADAVWIDDIVFPVFPETVQIVPNYKDTPNEGFFDPVLGPARRAAFEYALGVWERHLYQSYDGETITVDASMDPMGGDPGGATLGMGGPAYIHANYPGLMPDTWYGSALANHVAGFDLASQAEIVIQLNSDVDNDTVLGPSDWYYGIDNDPDDDIDFVTVVLHELAHGLNFLDLINADGSWFDTYPGIYDRYLEDAEGRRLTDMSKDSRRAEAIVSDSLWWGGEAGIGDRGRRPRIFAPPLYIPGTSVSHLDFYQNGPPISLLMGPVYLDGEHSLTPIEEGVFTDLGWTITPDEYRYHHYPYTDQNKPPESRPLNQLIPIQFFLPRPPNRLVFDSNRHTTAFDGDAVSPGSTAATDWLMENVRPMHLSPDRWRGIEEGEEVTLPETTTTADPSPDIVSSAHLDHVLLGGMAKRMEKTIDRIALIRVAEDDYEGDAW